VPYIYIAVACFLFIFYLTKNKKAFLQKDESDFAVPPLFQLAESGSHAGTLFLITGESRCNLPKASAARLKSDLPRCLPWKPLSR
jgi:hypothetical protein